MFDAWKQLPYVAEIRSRTERVSATRDAVNRSLKSYYKKYLKEAYGGAEWANIVLAIGVVDADIVECVNEEVPVDARRRSAKIAGTRKLQASSTQFPMPSNCEHTQVHWTRSSRRRMLFIMLVEGACVGGNQKRS